MSCHVNVLSFDFDMVVKVQFSTQHPLSQNIGWLLLGWQVAIFNNSINRISKHGQINII